MKPIFKIAGRWARAAARRAVNLPAILLAAAVGCAGGADRETVTIYCGRGESLVGPVVQAFEEETGIQVDIRYGGTADLAAQILEEGDLSPADVYYGQDAGALGQLASEGRLSPLPESILDRVPARFRDPDGRWVGTTGRAPGVRLQHRTPGSGRAAGHHPGADRSTVEGAGSAGRRRTGPSRRS